MTAAEASNEPLVSLANLPATREQRRIVFAVAATLLAAFGITAPFAGAQLPSFISFNPTVEAMVFVNDLVTSILLFSQYSISRSRAILALAIGYLYTALIVIPHVLAFPGAFAGLLDAGPQTSAWLYYFWTAGTPIAVIAYALLSDADPTGANEASARSAIGWSAVLVIGLVSGITWITTAGHEFLPSLMTGNHYASAVVYIANPLAILIAAIALALLWSRRRSVLDYWLILVIFSLILNFIVAAFLAKQRYSLGFYASRGFTLVTSMLVLGLLLWEMTNLYTRLARSNVMLERERHNKLMNIEAVTASIAHEVRQPLGAAELNGSAALDLLSKAPPDLEELREILNDMIGSSRRVSEVFDGIHSLFRKVDRRRQPVDMNGIALEVLRSLRGEIQEHGVTARPELTPDLPVIEGDRNQLQQVLFNLVHNAVEAMAATTDRSRVLRLTTERRELNAIAVAVQDSGPGIDPKQLAGIFDAFVTTKENGIGLGLAICRMIVERHGGNLSASSDGKNGALFQLELPIHSRNTDRVHAG